MKMKKIALGLAMTVLLTMAISAGAQTVHIDSNLHYQYVDIDSVKIHPWDALSVQRLAIQGVSHSVTDSTATVSYQLYINSTDVEMSGTLKMSAADYAAYNDDSYLFTWAAGKLELTIKD